jgi:integrase
MPRVTLTDRFVAGAKPAGKDRQTYFFDSKTPGLALRVSDTGHRGWTFQFTPPGEAERVRTTLGSYPAMPLAAARTKAEQARHGLQDGIDPRTSLKQNGGAAAMTLAQLVTRYVTDPDKAQLRSIKEINRRLAVNALPLIGHIRLDQLTRRDVKDVTDKIMRRKARTQAWHTHKDLHAVLAWGVHNDFLQLNPIAGVGAPGGFTAGERNLSDDEIRALWAVLPTALAKSKTCQRIIQLALICGQRLGEISGIARAELDLKNRLWTIPGARTKNKHAHTVPLSDMAVQVIEAALADAGKSTFVFPDEDGGPLASARITRAILRAHETDNDRPHGRFGIAPWSAHDLRRTVLTNLAKLGVAPHVIGHVANHRSLTKAGVTFAHYVQHSFEGEKQHALDLWADRLQAIVGGGAAAVVPIRGGRGRR